MLTAAGYQMGQNGVVLSPRQTDDLHARDRRDLDRLRPVIAEHRGRRQRIGINLVVTPKAWNTVISDVELGPLPGGTYVRATRHDAVHLLRLLHGMFERRARWQDGAQDWGRFCDPKATKLLAQFAAATTPAEQQRPPTSCRRSSPRWRPWSRCSPSPTGASSTRPALRASQREQPYATGQSRYPGAVLVLTTVKPV